MLALLGDIGGGELLVIFVAALLLFGSKRLPEIARTLGRLLENLRQTSQSFRDQLLSPAEDEAAQIPPAPLNTNAAPGQTPSRPSASAQQPPLGAPPDDLAG